MATSSSDRWPIPLKQHIPTLIFITVTVLTSNLVSRTQPTAYLDEIFHIPQAQQFCSALSSTSLFSTQQVWRQLTSVRYDAQLTTPPGMYAISVGMAKVLPGWECKDVVWLRSTNLVLLLTLPVLVARILGQIEEQARIASAAEDYSPSKTITQNLGKEITRHEIEMLQAKAKLQLPPTPSASHDDLAHIEPPTISIAQAALPAPTGSAAPLLRALKQREASAYTMALACTICFLPPLWFFGFLYYTDLASTWLVLAMLSLYNDLNTSNAHVAPTITGLLIALTSILAVAVRQTNIVWIGFAAAQATLSRVGKHVSHTQQGSDPVTQAIGMVKGAFGDNKKGWWTAVAINAAPMVPVLAVCVLFLRWNGSIVLGEKAAHQVALHLPQMGYFVAFALGFGLFPLLFSLQSMSHKAQDQGPSSSTLATFTHSVRSAVSALIDSTIASPGCILALAAALAGFYIAVDRFTIEHAYMLADNRHYTFYIWRKYRSSYAIPALDGMTIEPKLAVVPLFALALIAWSRALTHHAVNKRTGALFSLLFWMATAAVLVPTPLIEPRYFLMAYLLLRIYSHPYAPCEKQEQSAQLKWIYLALEAATYAAVNVITVGLFVNRPFQWPSHAVDVSRNEHTTMRFLW